MSLIFIVYIINTVYFVGVTELSTLINIAHFGQRLFGICQSLGEPTAATVGYPTHCPSPSETVLKYNTLVYAKSSV
jgi:hypothetical protein